jgi:hypothetical protein
MNLENSTAEIIVYSLSVAFVFKTMLVPYIKKRYLNYLEYEHDKKRNAIPKDDKWGDLVGELNSEWNNRRKRIVSRQYKPWECIKCMTFWVSLSTAIWSGYQAEAAFVGIVGLACGMLLEGILMRYF